MRHGRLETVRHDDGKFHIRLTASNGKVLMHSEELTGRQVKRARKAIEVAFDEDRSAYFNDCACAACQREEGR